MECLKIRFIKTKVHILLQKITKRLGDQRKIFDKPSIKTSMFKKASNTLHGYRRWKFLNNLNLSFIHLNALGIYSIAKHNTLLHLKVTFFQIQHQISFFTSSKNKRKIVQTKIKWITNDREFIHKYLKEVLHHIRKNCHHAPLESSGSITKPKWHSPKSKGPIRTNKSSLLLIFESYSNLVITGINF